MGASFFAGRKRGTHALALGKGATLSPIFFLLALPPILNAPSAMKESGLVCKALVVKIASRCNLNCTYCYMYNGGDDTYKLQPKFMSRETMQALLDRVREHCLAHALSSFTFVFHGGEPLLASKALFREFVERARAVLGELVTVQFSVQTNGVLLDEEWCQTLGSLGIHIGISLDGLPEHNDKYRVDHAGKGSYHRIVEGFRVARQSVHTRLPPGLLCVIDITADPVATYRHFKQLHSDNVDFLLPDANYAKPSYFHQTSDYTPYGDWLIAVFDAWRADTNRLSIRFFRNIMQAVLGKPIGSDMMGDGRNEVLVIETNGDIESVDVLKICGQGFTKNNANLRTTSLDEALATPLAQLYNLSHVQLPRKCLACPINDICGGGYLPHRYSRENGFDNPTFYCHDFMKLITHIQNAVLGEFPAEVLELQGVALLRYEEAVAMTEAADNAAEPVYLRELLAYRQT